MTMVSTAAIPIWASAMTDEEVIGRVRAGETAFFEILMRRHNQRLYRAVRSILNNESEAEDVIQDAYVRSYIHLDQFDGRAKFSTWLTRIAIHEALARLRKRRRVVDIDVASGSLEESMKLESKSASPEQEVLTGTLKMVLESAFDRLPETYRSVFMLREVEGMSTAETAECLDISENSVKVRLHRARVLLRKEIYTQTGAATVAAFQFGQGRCDRVVSAVLDKICSFGEKPDCAGRVISE